MMDAMEVAAALRRAADGCSVCCLNYVITGSDDCPQGSCDECTMRSLAWFRDAADAIERCALPEGVEWPVVGGRKVDFKTAFEPGLGALEAVCIYSNGACEVMSHDGIIKNVKDIHIARPEPKALDADGVEIRVGDVRCRGMEGEGMSEELKPCPFCGGEASVVVLDDEGNAKDKEYERTCKPVVVAIEEPLWGYIVECSECRHTLGGVFTGKEAADRFASALPVYYLQYCAKCGAKVVDE